MLQDLRYALRMLVKSRGYTAMAVLALALGIGANTAIFSVADAFLLKPVALPDLDRLVMLMEARPAAVAGAAMEGSLDWNRVSPADYLGWKRQTRSFAHLSAYHWSEVNLTGSGEPERLEIVRAGANFFDTLGAAAMLGRTFLSEGEKPGKTQVAVLSYGLWQRRFGSARNMIGQTIKLDGLDHVVIGVMDKKFNFPVSAEMWTPLSLSPQDAQVRGQRYLQVLARLRPESSIRQASAEMSIVARRIAGQYPETNRGWGAQVIPIRHFLTGDLTERYTLMLMVAVGFVLLIACANVANLQFARGAARQREFAVRTALGAKRARVVRQLLTESITVSLVGAAVGLLAAAWGVELILHYMPADIARYVAGWYEIRLDARAFGFALAIAVLSGIISGLMPALQSSKPDLNETLKESGRGNSAGCSRQRMRGVLVVSELALALVLLIGAALMVKGTGALLAVNKPYAPEKVLSIQLNLAEMKYTTRTQQAAFYSRVLEQLRSVSQIQSAALVTALPYGNGLRAAPFRIEGRPVENGEFRTARIQVVSADYFHLMHVPLRAGRILSERDGAGALPVAMISADMAERYWPGQSPLGRRIRMGAVDASNSWLTIVGVTGNVKYDWFEKEPLPVVYQSYPQAATGWTTLAVRTAGDPESAIAAIRSQVAKVDPDQPLAEIKTLDRVMTDALIGLSYVAVMMTVLGVIALVLSAVGVAGLMAYSVTERTHEIGVRMALGAQRNSVLRMLVARGMLLAAIGLAIGFTGSVFLAQMLSSLIFGVSATDWTTFGGVLAVMAAVALAASYIPARRASRLDPTLALRHE